MNLERLRAVQAQEREADSLRPLADDFYEEVSAYLRDLRADRDRAAEAADDPFGSEEVRRLTDEIETAEEVAEAIYERRVGKLVKRATLAASGMSVDRDGLTTEEAALFDDLVGQIETHREAVFADFDGRDSADGEEPGEERDGSRGQRQDAAASPGGEPTVDAGSPTGGQRGAGEDDDSAADGEDSGEGADDRRDDASAATGSGGGADDRDHGAPAGTPGSAAPAEERVTLRITRDVGEVLGVDERTYELAAEDVVTLPAANAKPLLDRDAAEPID